jgi:hypothetical protein
MKGVQTMYYANEKDYGRNGRNFEVAFRSLLIGVEGACNPQGVADILVKRGVTLECKTGCGWLISPTYASKEEASEILAEGGFKMKRAMFVAYLPEFNGENAEDALILTQSKFMAIFAKYGKLRVKQSSSNGMWGITIQSYIPTEKFKASKKVYQAILIELFDNGEYYDTFAERMGLI